MSGYKGNRIIVLDSGSRHLAEQRAPELLRDPTTRIVAPDSTDPELARIVPLTNHTLLLPNRWANSGYSEATAAFKEIALAKYAAVAEVCQLLGARRLDVEHVTAVSDDRRVTTTVGLKATPFTASATADFKAAESVRLALRATWEWKPRRADRKKALPRAQELGLTNDPVVGSLIRQRLQAGGELRVHQLELDISSEANREINATLQIGGSLRKIGTEFEATIDTLREHKENMTLHISVHF
jgi:hypothetical protein